MSAVRSTLSGFRSFLGAYSMITGAAALVAIFLAALLLVLFPELQLAARSLTALALVLLVLFVVGAYGEVRSTVVSRKARYGTNTGIMVLAFLGIASLVNVVAAQSHARIDLTAGGQYTLSRQTTTVLKNLQSPVKVTGFFTQDADAQATQQAAQNLLAEYQYQSDKITYEFVDPEAKPGVARQYNVQQDGALVFENEGRRKQIFGVGEQDFTGAILNVTGTEQPKVRFVTGHGEPDLESTDQSGYSYVKQGLLADNYDVSTINLSTIDKVPADTALLIVAGPKNPWLANEVNLLDQYLHDGGKALVLLDPDASPELRPVLAKWGVSVKDGIVVDNSAYVQPDVTVPVARNYLFTQITKDLGASFFPGAAGLTVQVPQDDQDHVSAMPLAITSAQSFLETDPSKVQFDDGQDQRGPFPLGLTVQAVKPIGERPPVASQPAPGTAAAAAAATPPPGTNPTRMVIFADSDFARNQFFYSLGNSDLFLNSVNWLTAQEDLISIRPKPAQFRRFIPTNKAWAFIEYSSVILWPLALILAGGVVWWRRR